MSVDLGLTARPLRVLLVDDEAHACLRLRSLLSDCLDPPSVVVGEAYDVPSAMSYLSQNVIDLVLLDVAMPGLDGTQLAAELAGQEQAPAVVFVTAHTQHALRAFDLNAIDYLTKPVRAERLCTALKKVQQRHASAPQAAANELSLVVTERGRIRRVPMSAVLYFKAELKYVTLRTAHLAHVMDGSLSDLAQRLGPDFIRIHRNALVARRAMREIERRLMFTEDSDAPSEQWAVRVAPVDEWLVVSRRNVALVREILEAGSV